MTIEPSLEDQCTRKCVLLCICQGEGGSNLLFWRQVSIHVRWKSVCLAQIYENIGNLWKYVLRLPFKLHIPDHTSVKKKENLFLLSIANFQIYMLSILWWTKSGETNAWLFYCQKKVSKVPVLLLTAYFLQLFDICAEVHELSKRFL